MSLATLFTLRKKKQRTKKSLAVTRFGGNKERECESERASPPAST
jgi:hypothetical protein